MPFRNAFENHLHCSATHAYSLVRSLARSRGYWPIWCNFCVCNISTWIFLVLRFVLAQLCILHISNVLWAHAKVCMPADYKLNTFRWNIRVFVVVDAWTRRCLLTVLFAPISIRTILRVRLRTHFATDRLQVKKRRAARRELSLAVGWKRRAPRIYDVSLFGNGKHIRILARFWFSISLATLCYQRSDGIRQAVSQRAVRQSASICPFLRSLSFVFLLLAVSLHI